MPLSGDFWGEVREAKLTCFLIVDRCSGTSESFEDSRVPQWTRSRLLKRAELGLIVLNYSKVEYL